ncbi:MAG TPA: hypothetical protein DEA90_12665 [Opitutae bacterium]|nr:hypothetical protein [Puniceicoccaceae bacterium]HBR95005.1 hypothetical protein [Opitutae bacterium]|tara:strand:+ start:1042 stop:1467 length:426 start_codon:yes stop_codon:yes gene_type:complete
MKTLTFWTLALFAVLFTSCSTPQSQRISQNQATFDTYTPGERQMIRTQQIAVGFDQDMVRMSWGDPTHEKTVSSATGKQIVWEYRQIKPSMGISLGGGVGSRGSGVGIGTGVNVNPNNTKLLKRVVFDRQTGKVSTFESYN